MVRVVVFVINGRYQGKENCGQSEVHLCMFPSETHGVSVLLGRSEEAGSGGRRQSLSREDNTRVMHETSARELCITNDTRVMHNHRHVCHAWQLGGELGSCVLADGEEDMDRA